MAGLPLAEYEPAPPDAAPRTARTQCSKGQCSLLYRNDATRKAMQQVVRDRARVRARRERQWHGNATRDQGIRETAKRRGPARPFALQNDVLGRSKRLL